MASQLNLDRSDPGVNDLVSAWSDGGKYRVTLDITQSKSSPSMNTFEVTSIEDQGEPTEEVETAEVEAQTPAPKSKPAVQVKY